MKFRANNIIRLFLLILPFCVCTGAINAKESLFNINDMFATFSETKWDDGRYPDKGMKSYVEVSVFNDENKAGISFYVINDIPVINVIENVALANRFFLAEIKDGNDLDLGANFYGGIFSAISEKTFAEGTIYNGSRILAIGFETRPLYLPISDLKFEDWSYIDHKKKKVGRYIVKFKGRIISVGVLNESIDVNVFVDSANQIIENIVGLVNDLKKRSWLVRFAINVNSLHTGFVPLSGRDGNELTILNQYQEQLISVVGGKLDVLSVLRKDKNILL